MTYPKIFVCLGR